MGSGVGLGKKMEKIGCGRHAIPGRALRGGLKTSTANRPLWLPRRSIIFGLGAS